MLFRERVVEFNRTLMIATCLKGEALEVCKLLNVDDVKNYGIVVTSLREAFKPEDIKYTSLSEFHERTIFQGSAHIFSF